MGGRRWFARVAPAFLFLSSPQFLPAQQRPSVSELIRQFEQETVFWRQFEVAKAIVAAHDPSVLRQLEAWLTHDDRHLRGNAAYIFAKLGDSRGFDVITSILNDQSEQRTGEVVRGPRWTLRQQVREDRYYAAHLLGDVGDPRAIPVLVSLLPDPDVNSIVPWSLARIGDASAIPPLIRELSEGDANMRVLSIYALSDLKATAALPRLHELLNDNARSNFDRLESVAEAARAAIAKLESAR